VTMTGIALRTFWYITCHCSLKNADFMTEGHESPKFGRITQMLIHCVRLRLVLARPVVWT